MFGNLLRGMRVNYTQMTVYSRNVTRELKGKLQTTPQTLSCLFLVTGDQLEYSKSSIKRLISPTDSPLPSTTQDNLPISSIII